MSDSKPLGLFEGFGIELEYMLVNADTLSVVPRADDLLAAAAGEVTTEYERGDYAWNNELARHVIEFKTNGPRARLDGLADGFAGEIRSRQWPAGPAGPALDAHRHASVDGSGGRPPALDA